MESRKTVVEEYVYQILNLVKAKNPCEPEFHQTVLEVVESLKPVLERHPHYQEEKILERIT
jgi:glutamate dehydrogenase (NADP+)